MSMRPHFGRKNIFQNGRNPTSICIFMMDSYVLNNFSLWFGGFRGPERENRQKPQPGTDLATQCFPALQFILLQEVTSTLWIFGVIAIFSRDHEI